MPATSDENVIKLLERKKPDLVLLDVSMPGIDAMYSDVISKKTCVLTPKEFDIMKSDTLEVGKLLRKTT